MKGFIDYLANVKGVVVNGVRTDEKVADYGAAALILATPSDVLIGDDIINYAKDKNVAILKRVPIGITSYYMKEGHSDEEDAMRNNQVKFTSAYVVSPSVNKKTNSAYYKAQQTEVERSGSNKYGKKVKVNWLKL